MIQKRQVEERLSQAERMAVTGEVGIQMMQELNHPLTAIIGFSDLSLEKLDDPNYLRKTLGIIRDQALRCKKAIRHILDFSREQEDGEEFIEVNDTIKNVLLLLEPLFPFNKIQGDVFYASSVLHILAIPRHFKEILINIILNACQAMQRGGVLSVEVKENTEEKTVKIFISDTGPGIPEENLENIFQPFFTTKPGTGTGLGLSVSLAIVKRYGGKIEVKNRYEDSDMKCSGCTFIITWPWISEEKGIV